MDSNDAVYSSESEFPFSQEQQSYLTPLPRCTSPSSGLVSIRSVWSAVELVTERTERIISSLEKERVCLSPWTSTELIQELVEKCKDYRQKGLDTAFGDLLRVFSDRFDYELPWNPCSICFRISEEKVYLECNHSFCVVCYDCMHREASKVICALCQHGTTDVKKIKSTSNVIAKRPFHINWIPSAHYFIVSLRWPRQTFCSKHEQNK
jgi:hypothetical protein